MPPELVAAFTYLAWTPAVLAVLYYSNKHWWRSEAGWHLMTYMVALALLLSTIVLGDLFGNDYPGRNVIRFVIYTLMVVSLWWRLILIVKVNVQARRLADQLEGKPHVPWWRRPFRWLSLLVHAKAEKEDSEK